MRQRLTAFRKLPLAALLLLPPAVLLVILLVAVFRVFDPFSGFDYGGHLDYVRFVDATASLPLADRGWQMYHPPAYYILTVGIFEVLHRLGVALTLTDAGRGLAALAWIVEGAIGLAVVRLLGGTWLGASATAALLWLLPGQAMMGSMLYNETLTDLAVVVLLLGLVLLRRLGLLSLVLIGAGFALAAMSKYSGLVAAVAALPFLVWAARDRLKGLAVALLPGTVFALLFYGRNVLHFGTPLPLNSDLFNLKSWDPFGFGDPAGFFTSMNISACAVHSSFWGAWWKWLWATDCYGIPPWRQVVGGWLLVTALLATAVVLAGLLWVAVRRWREPASLVLVAIPAAVFAAFIYYNVRQPALTSDKGVYMFAALPALAVACGLFISRLPARLPAAGPAYAAILAWSVEMVHASGVG